MDPEILVFTPKNWAEARDVRVIGVDDTKDDGTVEYEIIFRVVSKDLNYNKQTLAPIGVSNKDDDVAGQYVEAGARY